MEGAKEVNDGYSKDQRNPLASNQPKHEQGITFAAQEKLPKLPIPELGSTMTKYLAALKPLQSPREHAETKQAVEEFLKNDGPELNERLKKYATGKTNYIEQFWYDSYLNFDNPVVLNLNPFFLLEDDPTPARNNQVTPCSVTSNIRIILCTPLCMFQYSRLFGTARVPTENGCHIGEDPESKHLVVLCHGQFYWFDVLDDNSDLIMTERDVSINLQTIVDDAQKTPIQDAAKGALGVLSTENRKIWSGLRDVLTREEGSNNADCLGIVDSALFILCLDYTEPNSQADLCQNMLCGTSQVEKGVQIGTCTNRWYDKLQIIVCANGSAGINFEHTGVDGHTVLRFASDLYTDTILRFARTINGQAPSLWASTSPDPAKRDPSSFGDFVSQKTRLADLIQQNEFQTLDFAAYGKNFMTSMGFSPDAVWQRAVDEDGAEAASSNGLSSDEYSSSIDASSSRDPSLVGSPGRNSIPSDGDEIERRSTRTRDSGWEKLNTTVLSTSNCGNPSLRQFGFGPTSGDGFGIGYIIKDEGISICTSSKHRQTKRFVDALESYLLEIRRVLKATQRRGTSPKSSRAREASANRPAAGNRLKSRGRVIRAADSGKKTPGTMTPVDESAAVSDDEGLGGYGFFDAGMLPQALKARGEGALDELNTKPSERANASARRREIGKKLRLSEY
ncbi:hypothetical protein DID88_009593 [Monilinia fructigena]|uniref:Choline/carnitine acyltransferase domain-containing protein n=1 Tax=Monilinia fructigena TaxID=38457 RepID=A0A395INW9_9HELO|nr:hypothetical protein DID88_009593 [Monilinia fructigena]